MPKKRRTRSQKARPVRPITPRRAASVDDGGWSPGDGHRSTAAADGLAVRMVGGGRHQAGLENQVIALVNAARKRTLLEPLRPNEQLRRSARRHSADMAARGYFSHDDPDGGVPADRIRASGYPEPGAENIAMGQSSAAEVVHAWLNSPGHRANIMNPEFRAIGAGVHLGPDGPWWTQHFGYC